MQRQTILALVVGGVAPIGGCASIGDELDPDTSETQSAISLDNGLQINGIQNNGAYVNGLSLNGAAVNGLLSNGLPLNGLPLNGLSVNGLSLNGIGANGLPLNGLPLNGLSVNGLPLNGLPLNGLPVTLAASNGYVSNGLPLNGVFVNGLPLNGLGLNGLPLNGLFINGLPLNGLPLNGLPLNGLSVNGLPLNGLPLNGLRVNGTTASTAVKITNASGLAVNLTAAQETEFTAVMRHIARCALTSTDSFTIYSSSGAAIVYPGYHGLAPEWKTGPLERNLPGIDSDEEMRWCLEHYRKADSSNNLYQGLALNTAQADALKKLLKYAIECALPAGDSVNVAFPLATGTQAVTFSGALGLAPTWKTAALTTAGQQAVSACLGARTNVLGNTVRISLRGPATFTGLAASQVEKKQFSNHEGAFWGNLFGSAPALNTCVVTGGGPSGRLCTDNSCGFVDQGTCATTIAGCTQDAAGNWTGCGGAVVLNTFLMMESTSTASDYSSCARHTARATNGNVVDTDDGVWCWGDNALGQLGDGTRTSRAAGVAAGVKLPLPSPPRHLAGGANHTCARLRDGTLWCWGYNFYGQLGNGTKTDSAVPVQVTTLGNTVAKVSARANDVCAIKMDGTLWCWGQTYTDAGAPCCGRTTPKQIGATTLANQVIDVATGEGHGCAIKMDGTLWCWGDNYYGQVGDGSNTYRTDPVQVTALGNQVLDVAAGSTDACAIKADGSGPGTLWCWGYGGSGALGINSRLDKNTPTQVTTLGNQVLDVAPGSVHTCAIKGPAATSTLWCWGNDYGGRLGDGGTNTDKLTPVQVTLPAVVREVSIGWSSSAILSDGRHVAWGENTWGQLGDGTTTARSSPVTTTSLNLTALNEVESNNTAATATAMTAATARLTGYLSTSTDVDWAKFTLAPQQAASVDLEVPLGKNYDVAVYANGVALTGVHTGTSVAERVTFKNTTATTQNITVKVSGVSSAFSTTLPYRLRKAVWND